MKLILKLENELDWASAPKWVTFEMFWFDGGDLTSMILDME